MKKNVTDILDIHTHKQEVDSQGKSIINYPLLADSPLYMPLAENVEVAVGRGSYYSIGIHPWEVRESNVSQQLSFLQQQLQRKQFVAVGEAGLDKLAKASMELQLAVFKEQVKLSEKLGLPLIIHCVKAMEELLAVKKESRPQQPWVPSSWSKTWPASWKRTGCLRARPPSRRWARSPARSSAWRRCCPPCSCRWPFSAAPSAPSTASSR